jgi:hypothetical protein
MKVSRKISRCCQVEKRVTLSDIRRGIESRRFTAILDAMEDRIDPDKIERTRIANAKYRIETKPVLIRDILPKVMNDIRRQRRCRAIAVSSYQVRANTGHVDVQGEHRQLRSRIKPAW